MNNPLWQNFRMERPANIEEGEQILIRGQYEPVRRIFDFGDDFFIVVETDDGLEAFHAKWNTYEQVYDAG